MMSDRTQTKNPLLFVGPPLTPDHEPAEKQKIRNTEQSSASSIMRRVKEKSPETDRKKATDGSP